MRQQEYKVEKRKILKIYLIADVLILIGGILYAQDRFEADFSFDGSLIALVGSVALFIALSKRFSKRYRDLKLENDEDEESTLSEMTGEFGAGMVIGAGIIALCLVVGGMIFLLYLANFNLYKTFLFFMAFQLITDSRDFAALKYSKED